jgi:hypothetical protein
VDIKVEGFTELNRKLKQLDDKITRREVLKIQRKMAKPFVPAYSDELPLSNRVIKNPESTYKAGKLKESVSVETVPAQKVGGNPQVVVRPSTKGKKEGYYRQMVVDKGIKIGSNKRGSRKMINTVVDKARDRVASQRNSSTTAKYEKQMQKFIQKQINKLSS